MTGTTLSQTIASGKPAAYTLVATPQGGFTGSVALGCTSIGTAPYTSCSLSTPLIAISGASAQSFTVSINTVTEQSRLRRTATIILCLLLPCTIIASKRRHVRNGVLALCAGVLIALNGCSGSNSSVSPVLTTPAGTYQFQITADSVSGGAAAQNLTLTLIVQ